MIADVCARYGSGPHFAGAEALYPDLIYIHAASLGNGPVDDDVDASDNLLGV